MSENLALKRTDEIGAASSQPSDLSFELSDATRLYAAEAGKALLAARPTRPPNFERENRALTMLVDALAHSPTYILADLSQAVLGLLGAGSAGISLLKGEGTTNPTFYWPALVGQWAQFVGGEMPRHSSLGGVLVDVDSVLLFEHPKDIFPAAEMLEPAITDALLAPFHINGRTVGAIWALHHDPAKKFDREDARVLTSMASFASAAYQTIERDAEQREAQERLRTLAEALPNHIWTADPAGMLDWFNERVYQYSGLGADALQGQGWASLVHPDDLAEAVARWSEVLVSGEVYETQFRLRSVDGEYRWHLARAVPVMGKDGKIAQWVGTNTDIEGQKRDATIIAQLNATLEKRVEERTAELVSAQDSLRQSQKMEALGQLTGGIAHDFNNMLAVVIGAINLVERRHKRGQPIEQMLNSAQEGAKRAADLTHRLMTFSRQLPLNPQVVDAAGMVKSMSAIMRRTLGEAVKIETVFGGGLWMAKTDAGQLENAILNLSLNARDAMTSGGNLTIETSNADLDDEYARTNPDVAPGQYVLIAVSDTGAGMTPAVIEKAFEPFFTTKGVGKGTGLGLSQVFGYIKQSQGHIKIYSEVGLGTTVKMYLPRASEEMQTVTDISRRLPTPLGSPNEVILIVEDEDIMREVSVAALRELGYTVVHTSSAARALEMLNNLPQITLLFTDLVMPDMTGDALAEQALKRHPHLKVLFTTGYARNAVVHNGILEAGTNCLSKPFTVDQLGKKVREALS